MRYRTVDPVVAGAWPTVPATSPQKIRWGAIFAGTVLGLALLALLTALWFALAYDSGVRQVRVNLEWYVGVSAIACLFVGGLLAGWLSGVRGAGAGAFNGMAIWAMILILTIAVGVPALINVFNLGRTLQLADTAATQATNGVNTTLWATFWSILGGLVASALGGALGGAITTPANADLAAVSAMEERVDRTPSTTVVADPVVVDENDEVRDRAS